MSNKKTTREQFKEMVTYLMEEGTDNEIIEGYVDTFMLIHNESKMAKRIKEYDTFIVDLLLTIGSKCHDNEILIKNGHNFRKRS